MRILLHSGFGDSAGLAYQMQSEGAKVDFFIKERSNRDVMAGVVPQVETLEEGLKNKPDFVLMDLNGDGKTADKMRKDGFSVVAGSEWADKLEMDRSYGVNVAKQYGLKVPKTTEFTNLNEAIAFVKKNNKPYAIKIDNNKSESSSYVGSHTEDMVDYLNYSKEEGKITSSDTFILQEVVKGAEISTELWFSNGNPIWPANSTFETKKFMAGELGPRTGCETSAVFHYDGMQSKVVDKTIRRILPLLKYSRWTGPIDVNCIVSEEDHEPYFLEWTPRLGYSAIYAFMAILGMPLSEFLYAVSRGTSKIPFKNLWSTSLKLSIPPYPVEVEDHKAAEEVYGQCKGVRVNGEYGKDFIPVDVMKGKNTEFVGAGTSGIIGECLGRGSSILEAWRASQKVFKSVEAPNKQGRYTDGIEDAWKRILKLRQMGYTDIPNPSGSNQSMRGSGKIPSTPLGK